MSLKVWIGQEFETPHERNQVAEVIGLMRQAFADTVDEINLLCNCEFGDAPVDLAVLKEDALVLIDLKTANGQVRGGANGVWTFNDPAGRPVEINKGRRKNPFLQLRGYRHSAIDYLGKHGQIFMSNQQLACAKCIDRFVKCLVLLCPDLHEGKDRVEVEGTYKLWFSACRPSRFCEFIQSQTSSFAFDSRKLRKLLTGPLNLVEAKLIGNAPALPSGEDTSGTVEELEPLPPMHVPLMPLIPPKKSQDTSVTSPENASPARSESKGEVISQVELGEKIMGQSAICNPQEAATPELTGEDVASTETPQQLQDSAVWPEVSPNEVKYISNGVRAAVNAKKLKGLVTEIFHKDAPDFAVPGNWGALCVYEYEDSGKSVEQVKGEIDYFLDDDQNPSYIFGTRIVWPFPADSLRHLDAKKEQGSLSVERQPVEPMDDLPTLAAPLRELSHQTALPRVLDILIYRVLGAPFSVDSRRGDVGARCEPIGSLDALGRYLPISYCEAYGIFDVALDRLWEPSLSRKRELIVQIVDGGYGGSFWGWMWAVRRYVAENQLTRVKVFVKESDPEAWSRFVEVADTLKRSNEFSFALDVVTGDSSEKVDFCLLNGRRDGTGMNPISGETLDYALRQLATDGVLFVSDIADLYQAQTVARAVGKVLEAKSGVLFDLTERLNGGAPCDLRDGCLQSFGCQVVSQGCLTQRRITYRLLGCGVYAQLFN